MRLTHLWRFSVFSRRKLLLKSRDPVQASSDVSISPSRHAKSMQPIKIRESCLFAQVLGEGNRSQTARRERMF
jgi:hypothetical protein